MADADVFGKLKVKKLLKKTDETDTDVSDITEEEFTGIRLKSGHVGPDISVFGSGELKTIYMIQVMVKNRALYTVTVKPSEKHKNTTKIIFKISTLSLIS